MGHKTVAFKKEIEQRTYLKGEFTGKYRGILNNLKSRSKFEFYDIHIYNGEINNLKNEIEHPEVINQTIYDVIVSETQLTHKSFENVLVNFDHIIENYTGFRLAIKEPKLEHVKISDVLKDGNQTFGTLHCSVSGYLIELIIETSEIEVDTCDYCNQFIEECTCSNHLLSDIKIQEEPPSINTEESFWSRNFGWWTKNNKNWNWNIFDNSSFGCLGLFGKASSPYMRSLFFLFIELITTYAERCR